MLLGGWFGVARCCYVAAMVLLGVVRCCYVVAMVLLGCYYVVTMKLLGVAMVLLGDGNCVARWLLWCC